MAMETWLAKRSRCAGVRQSFDPFIDISRWPSERAATTLGVAPASHAARVCISFPAEMYLDPSRTAVQLWGQNI